ncbi:MAG: DNA/RNA non-specific endonuclease [bacterium]|nr:DNA/RNA non-specific endonuclease [bacterium]
MDYSGMPGKYTYSQTQNGKLVSGVIANGAVSDRDPAAQRSAGGKDRQAGDQGGHLMANRFGGRNDSSNLDAQAANVNQKDQANVERNVSTLAANPNHTVSMSIANFNSVGERPDATMIHVGVRNNTTGKTDEQYISFQNASHALQESWNNTAAQADPAIDPSQNAGMTDEQREAANTLCGAEDAVDDTLGSGWSYTDFDVSFLDAGAAEGEATESSMGNAMSAGEESEGTAGSEAEEGTGEGGGSGDDDGLGE